MKLKDAKYFGIKLSPHRIKNDKGQLIVTGCEFARTGEQKYHSSELTEEGEVDKLNKFIYIKRPVEEVSDPKTVASFEGAPVTEDHPDEDVKVGVNYDQLAKGFATNVKYIADSDTEGHLQADFIFTDADLIKKIENNEINELSAGYNCDVDEDTWVCRHIRGNHIAVVAQARAGHQARLLDRAYKSTSKSLKTLKIGDKLVKIADSYSYELEEVDGSKVKYTDYYERTSSGKKKFLVTIKDSVNKTVKYAVPENSFKDVEALINKCKFDIKNKEEVEGYTQFEVVGDAEAESCWKDLDAKVKDINSHKNVVVSKDSKSIKDSSKFMGVEPYYLDEDTLILEIPKYVGGEYRKLEIEMWLDEGNSFHYNVYNDYDTWTATDKEVKDFGVDKSEVEKFMLNYINNKDIKDADDSDEAIYTRRREIDKAIREYFKDKPEFEVEGFYNGNDSTEGSIYVVDYYRRRDKNKNKPRRADSDSFEDYVEDLASYVDDRCSDDLRKISGVGYIDVGVSDYDSSESINVDIQIDCENVTK